MQAFLRWSATSGVRSFLPLARYSETTLTRRHLARTALRARSLAARVPRIDGRGRCAISAMRRLIWCRYTLEPHKGQIIDNKLYLPSLGSRKNNRERDTRKARMGSALLLTRTRARGQNRLNPAHRALLSTGTKPLRTSVLKACLSLGSPRMRNVCRNGRNSPRRGRRNLSLLSSPRVRECQNGLNGA